jgi:hypothetical protein
MQIRKTEESPILVRRQIEFLQLFRDDIVSINETSYEYEYTVGLTSNHNPDSLVEFLKNKVWSGSPLMKDVLFPSTIRYAMYITDLYQYLFNCPIPESLEQAITDLCRIFPVCLVHGDCTFENFICPSNNKQSIVPIDPGLPRGFCNKENDIGKLLQSSMTYWSVFKHGKTPKECKEFFVYFSPQLEVSGYSLLSLYTHWIRILKNANRHDRAVFKYGSEIVVPVLEKELMGLLSNSSMGHRWDTCQLTELCDRLLP